MLFTIHRNEPSAYGSIHSDVMAGVDAKRNTPSKKPEQQASQAPGRVQPLPEHAQKEHDKIGGARYPCTVCR